MIFRRQIKNLMNGPSRTMDNLSTKVNIFDTLNNEYETYSLQNINFIDQIIESDRFNE